MSRYVCVYAYTSASACQSCPCEDQRSRFGTWFSHSTMSPADGTQTARLHWPAVPICCQFLKVIIAHVGVWCVCVGKRVIVHV